MNNKKGQNKILVVLVIFLLLSNLAMLLFFVILEKPGKKEADSQPRVTDWMKRELDLSDEQAATFRELRDQHKATVKPMFDSMKVDKNRFYAHLHDSIPVSDSVLEKEATAIGDQQAALELKLYRHFHKLRGLCTEEQRPRFDTMVHKFINRNGSKKSDKK